MSEKGRSFTKVQKLENFQSFCTRVAKQYANSQNEFTSSYFMRSENITKSCFYRILEEAIVCNWVTEKEFEKMQEKSLSNQKAHAENAGRTTLVHYAKLRAKREENILNSYSDSEIKELAEEFAKSPDSKSDFAEKKNMRKILLDKVLKKAFIENIVNDDICKAIEKRSMAKDSSERTKEFFKQLWKVRKENTHL